MQTNPFASMAQQNQQYTPVVQSPGLPFLNSSSPYQSTAFSPAQMNTAQPWLNSTQGMQSISPTQQLAMNYADAGVGAQNQFLTDMGMQPIPQDTGFWGDMGMGDMMNFGLGALQLGTGMLYQNQALDQAQQGLDLNKTMYTDTRADKAAQQKAFQDRATVSANQQAMG